MEDNRRNQTPEITPATRREIRANLRKLDDESLFRDIDRSKAMRRHPFATNRDAAYFTLCIHLARQELHRRLRKELEAL